jgi:putative membrane protein
MRRTLSLIFWGLVAVLLVTVGLANRDLVTLRLVPEGLSALWGGTPDLDVPVFVVVLAGFAAGMLLGLVWEWIREIPERAQARATARELERLRAEVARLQGRPGDGRDEVAVLLGGPAAVPVVRR